MQDNVLAMPCSLSRVREPTSHKNKAVLRFDVSRAVSFARVTTNPNRSVGSAHMIENRYLGKQRHLTPETLDAADTRLCLRSLCRGLFISVAILVPQLL